MEYIVIPAKDKAEKDFFMSLLKKMHKEVSTLSSEDVEDIFIYARTKRSRAVWYGKY